MIKTDINLQKGIYKEVAKKSTRHFLYQRNNYVRYFMNKHSIFDKRREIVRSKLKYFRLANSTTYIHKNKGFG